MNQDTLETLVFADGREFGSSCRSIGCGTVAAMTRRYPGVAKPNEDALAVIRCGNDKAVFAVADGFGGQPAGDQASRIAVESIVACVTDGLREGMDLRYGILNGFEEANRAVTALGVGAASTLAVAEFDHSIVRSYHAGDSEIVIVGQRGKVKLQTVSHSPVGYGVEAGLINREDAIHHDERNIVSNMIGSTEMRIEIGPHIQLQPRDRVLLGTDGVFDNLFLPEVVDIVRKGPLDERCSALVNACADRMATCSPDVPGKPDDIAIILFCQS